MSKGLEGTLPTAAPGKGGEGEKAGRRKGEKEGWELSWAPE
jgi:hypothetical protein